MPLDLTLAVTLQWFRFNGNVHTECNLLYRQYFINSRDRVIFLFVLRHTHNCVPTLSENHSKDCVLSFCYKMTPQIDIYIQDNI